MAEPVESSTPDLDLRTRTALPDDLAYLRASYPSATWRGHANFGQLSDFWLQMHDSLRAQGGQLEQITLDFREGRLDAGRYRQVFVPGLNHFLQHMIGHHQIEDRHYFPKFRSLDPRMVAGFDLLERDHEQIHEALLASAETANHFLSAFGQGAEQVRRAADAYAAKSAELLTLLMRHLADEEDLIVPAMLHHGERELG